MNLSLKRSNSKRKSFALKQFISKDFRNHPEIIKKFQKLPCIINKYSFEECIGYGASSIVFKVHHRGYEVDFAAKVIPISSNLQIQYIYGENEIQNLQNVSHTNIIKLYDHFIDGNFLFIILELCPNGTLRQRLKLLPFLNQESLTTFIYDIISSIDILHSQRIAHCDIKPTNIFIGTKNRPVLADFGLSKKILSFNQNHLEFFKTELCGAFQYRSPEMINQKSYNPFKSDIWSLGLTLLFFITGFEPTETFSNEMIRNAFIRAELPFQLEFIDQLIELLSYMIVIEPNDRYTSEDLLKLSIFQNNKKTFLIKPKFEKIKRSRLLSTSILFQNSRKRQYST